MTEALSLDQVEQRIKEIYEYFAENAPGITPLEEGELGVLWAIFDRLTGN